METKLAEQWATVDLMGHAQTAGRILMENGLLRVDVPVADAYRTEYYGMAAIYSIKIVSEEIARAYVRLDPDPMAYDAPIVTREAHLAAMRAAERAQQAMYAEINELRRRLTAVDEQLSLPAESDNPDIPYS